MAVSIPNYSFRYMRRGKPVFVPSSIGRRIGLEVKAEVESAYSFEPNYFHLRSGGHVAAMHNHRAHAYFARIDISRFFYSIPRRRVQSALTRAGVGNPAFYAKWSTVTNPYDGPRYVLPYGFIQSPILASLVVATSAIGSHLKAVQSGVDVSIYVDDISLSSDDPYLLTNTYEAILAVIEADGFTISMDKLRPPSSAIDIFNCDLANGTTVVRDDRIQQFYASLPSQAAADAFDDYCASVKLGNA